MIVSSEYGYSTAAGRGVAARVVRAKLALVALAPSSARQVAANRISTGTAFRLLHLVGVTAGHMQKGTIATATALRRGRWSPLAPIAAVMEHSV